MERYEGFQSRLWNFVKGGCLFFSILAEYDRIMKKKTDFVEIFQWSFSTKKISFDGNVNDSLAILNHIDGREWKRLKSGSLMDFPAKKDSFIVECWEDIEGKRHFKPTSYDVFQDSRIARVGRLLFYYYYFPM